MREIEIKARVKNKCTKVIWTIKGDTGRKLDSIEHEVEVSDGGEALGYDVLLKQKT